MAISMFVCYIPRMQQALGGTGAFSQAHRLPGPALCLIPLKQTFPHQPGWVKAVANSNITSEDGKASKGTLAKDPVWVQDTGMHPTWGLSRPSVLCARFPHFSWERPSLSSRQGAFGAIFLK